MSNLVLSIHIFKAVYTLISNNIFQTFVILSTFFIISTSNTNKNKLRIFEIFIILAMTVVSTQLMRNGVINVSFLTEKNASIKN